MRYTAPTVNATAESSITAKLTDHGDSIAQLYTKDEAILSVIQTRKERRKQGGLVKFACGSIDPRKVVVEEPWNGLAQDDDEESDEVEDGGDVEGMDVDCEGGEDENDDEEDEAYEEEDEASNADSQEGKEAAEDEKEEKSEIVLPAPSRKQKRKRGPERSMPSPPAKKVAFSLPPKLDRGKIEAAMSKKAVQQKRKPLKLAQTSSNGPKSLSKPSSTAAITSEKKKGRIANVTAVKTKSRSKGHLALAEKGKSEPEVYDFGKFF